MQTMIEDVKDKCKGVVIPFGFGYTEDMRSFFGKFGFEEFENNGLKMLVKRFEPVEFPLPVSYERKYQF